MPIAPLSLYPAVPLPCPRTAAHTEFQKDPPDTFSVGLNEENEDIFCWEVLMYGPEETPFEGGMFKAKLEFPDDFPSMPPKMTFTSEMYHPNIYPDGKVCISILHPPGTDIHNEQESADERWRPIISVEAVLVSVHSMLGDPNLDSPANIDSAVSVHSQCGEQCVLEYSANSAVFTLLSPPLLSAAANLLGRVVRVVDGIERWRTRVFGGLFGGCSRCVRGVRELRCYLGCLRKAVA